MRNAFAQRIGATAVAAALAIVGLSGPASADDTNGSISGHLVDAGGQPIADASVQIYAADLSAFVGGASTDESGAYSATDIPAGTYIVQFSWGAFSDWAHDHTDWYNADHLTVTAGADTTLDETAPATGTLTGTLTNADGTPASGVQVGIADDTDGYYPSAQTDDNGVWTAPVFAEPAGFVVSFRLPNGLTQYAPHTSSQALAATYPVGAGQTVTVDDQILPTGTISGTYLDGDGNPDANASVEIHTADASGNSATTDNDGHFEVPLFAGSYKVSFFGSDNKQQWAVSQLTDATASTITVIAGADTVVNDAHIATGTVTVTATDGSTGAPVQSFCAYIDSQNACTTTGSIVVSNVRQGLEDVEVSGTGKKYVQPPISHLQVTAGQNVDTSAVLQPAAIIKTTIVDAVTGAPVADACILPLVPGFTVWPDMTGYCSNKKGVVTIGPLTASKYALFVDGPRGGTYGAQWVGKTGGTGQEQDALVLNTAAGKKKTIPDIKLDRAGTIEGTVTSATDGTPLADAQVGPNPFTPGSGATGDLVRTDSTGHYELTDLGPYQWPIIVEADGFPAQWSGPVANRYNARTIQVRSGASVTDDIQVASGVLLKGTALKTDGTPITRDGGVLIIAYSAQTGDVMGSTFTAPDGTFSIPMLSGQKVRIQYFADDGPTQYIGYVGGPDSASATLVNIPPKGKTLHIVLMPGAGFSGL